MIKFIKRYYFLYKNKQFWRNYYRRNRDNFLPSDFAVFCFNNYIIQGDLIDIGCGNGRDSFYFAKSSQNINIEAIDMEKEEIDYLKNKNIYKNLQFKNYDFCKYINFNSKDYVYARFVMHTIPKGYQKILISNTYKNLKNKGLFLIEARSIKDEMFKSSKKISTNEGFTDHYRCFLDYEEILTMLKQEGFSILFSVEQQNLSKFKNENPWIIRIIAEK